MASLIALPLSPATTASALPPLATSSPVPTPQSDEQLPASAAPPAGEDDSLELPSPVSLESRPPLEDAASLMESIRKIEAEMSEMRTNVYELQEIRHSSARASASATSAGSSASSAAPASAPLDDLLISLYNHLERISAAIPTLQHRITRLAEVETDPDMIEEVQDRWEEVEEEWADVVNEVELLKEELKEDSWLVVFRTAATQAEEMMESLEKVASQCYDLIHQVRRIQNPGPSSSRTGPTSPPSSWGVAAGDSTRDSMSLSSFETVLKSFEAKKKYYYPSVERVLSILDKGVRERATRNGEVLLRHSSMLARWRSLSDKLNRLGTELTSAHLWLLTRESAPAQHHLPRPLADRSPGVVGRPSAPLASPPPSETGSSVGGSRYGDVPPSSRGQVPPRSETPTKTSTRRSSMASSLARSMSPVQAMFGKMTMRGSGAGGGAGRTPKTSPLNGNGNGSTSYFTSRFSSNKPRHSTGSPAPPTPQSDLFATIPGSSTSAESPPVTRVDRPRWNGSTKPLEPTSQGAYERGPATPPVSRIAVRRPSMGNLRGPGTFSPNRTVSPTLSDFGSGSASYRPPARPVTPSRIPRRQPSRAKLSMDRDEDTVPTSMMQRAHTDNGLPRATSESYSLGTVQVPSLSVQPASEPSSSPIINGSSARFAPAFPRTSSPPSTPLNPPRPLDRSQTPDIQIRANAIRSSFYTPSKPSSSTYTSAHTPTGGPSPRPRPSGRTSSPGPSNLFPSPPPSSFRDARSPQPTPPRPRATSSTSASSPGSASATRPGSRAGAATPSGEPPSKYRADKRNPLDVEVARIVNGVPNGIHVERIDPIPKGQLQASSPEANTAQYAFFSSAGRRVMSCRLLELNRGGKGTGGEMMKVRKVMVRVGGGWLDLEVHVFKLGL